VRVLERAAILIGVKKTGGLDTLRAVGSGIEAIWKWADSQRAEGMHSIAVLSDANDANGKESNQPVLKKVTAQHVKDAVNEALDAGIEKLLLYFAGHGANVRYSEYWLLSGAPEDANEAVNVQGSAFAARQSGIPHVIFISDACRTAAASIQSQAVEGSIVFPDARRQLDLPHALTRAFCYPEGGRCLTKSATNVADPRRTCGNQNQRCNPPGSATGDSGAISGRDQGR
jgi:hypothetical protein